MWFRRKYASSVNFDESFQEDNDQMYKGHDLPPEGYRCHRNCCRRV